MGRSTVPVCLLALVLILGLSIGTAMAVSTGINSFSGNPKCIFSKSDVVEQVTRFRPHLP